MQKKKMAQWHTYTVDAWLDMEGNTRIQAQNALSMLNSGQ